MPMFPRIVGMLMHAFIAERAHTCIHSKRLYSVRNHRNLPIYNPNTIAYAKFEPTLLSNGNVVLTDRQTGVCMADGRTGGV